MSGDIRRCGVGDGEEGDTPPPPPSRHRQQPDLDIVLGRIDELNGLGGRTELVLSGGAPSEGCPPYAPGAGPLVSWECREKYRGAASRISPLEEILLSVSPGAAAPGRRPDREIRKSRTAHRQF